MRQLVCNSLNIPRKRISKLCLQIDELQKGEQTEQSKAVIAKLRVELEHLYMDEELFWRQRCKNQWAREGDKNTRFFHAKATKRRCNNLISGLLNSEGVWQERVEDIERIIQTYFGELFQTSNPSSAIIDEVLEAMSPVVTQEMNHLLTIPYTMAEVTHALSHMSPLKSPGPDGFPTVFFHKYWDILGANVASCILDFLNYNHLPRLLNFTFIVLIPKVSRPTKIKEFRPISLCNVVYKSGSEMIANRLKPFLNGIISPTQSAFIPRRLITDNILVAFEVNHYLKCRTRGRTEYMALKLDVSKAYDRIEWIYLRRILLRMGFADAFVNTVMPCISSVLYSFLLNGKQFGALQPNRGLRQDDPLSPYLFICCVKGFIRMVEKAVVEATWGTGGAGGTSDLKSVLCR